MSKRTKILFIIFLAVALLVIVLFFYLRGYVPKYTWEPKYTHKNDQPYGLKLFYEILTETHTGDNFVYVNRTPKLFITNDDCIFLWAKNS